MTRSQDLLSGKVEDANGPCVKQVLLRSGALGLPEQGRLDKGLQERAGIPGRLESTQGLEKPGQTESPALIWAATTGHSWPRGRGHTAGFVT